jgi:hypothetical protein
MRAFRIEYSRFILGDVVLRRRLYLVIFSLLVAAIAAGVYLRQRAVKAAALRPGSGQAANCDTPAPPPPPITPPPKLPGFAIEGGCATGAEPHKPAAAKPKP